MAELPTTPSAPRWRDRVAVAAFLLIFLLPMFARSTVHPGSLPGSPAMLSKLHAISCLFTNKPSGWSTYYIQLRYPYQQRWETLEQAELFPMQPFGRRTRMHRLFAAWHAKPGPKTEDMARWILARHAELYPERPTPVAIRFSRTWMIPSRDAPPPAGWRHPDWREVPHERRSVIVTYLAEELQP